MNMANLKLIPQISEWSEAITRIPKSLRTRVTTAALLALSLVAGSPTQAETQPWVGVTPSGAPSTSAIASADKGVGYGQMTNDGREFSKLTDDDVEKLSDGEIIRYEQWQKNILKIKKQAAIEDVTRIDWKKQAAIEEDKRIAATPAGKWILMTTINIKNWKPLLAPPLEIQKSLITIASLNPPPSIILEARIICDKLGLKYT